jgi:hypothetical protein
VKTIGRERGSVVAIKLHQRSGERPGIDMRDGKIVRGELVTPRPPVEPLH